MPKDKAKIGFATSKLQRITLITCLSLNVCSSHTVKLFSCKVVLETHINSGPMYTRTDQIVSISIRNRYFPSQNFESFFFLTTEMVGVI